MTQAYLSKGGKSDADPSVMQFAWRSLAGLAHFWQLSRPGKSARLTLRGVLKREFRAGNKKGQFTS
jgi:hypothetical protein